MGSTGTRRPSVYTSTSVEAHDSPFIPRLGSPATMHIEQGLTGADVFLLIKTLLVGSIGVVCSQPAWLKRPSLTSIVVCSDVRIHFVLSPSRELSRYEIIGIFGLGCNCVSGPASRAAFYFPNAFSTLKGVAYKDIRLLHETYGNVVRISPNTLSFNTAQAWKGDLPSRPWKCSS